MNKSTRKVPEIRFKGFSEDWEQRKLGDIGKRFNGLTGKTKEDFGHGEAEYITYLNVFKNPIANKNETERIGVDSKQNEVVYGDVLFTTSSETPEEVGLSSVWLEKTPNVYLNSFCFGFRPNQTFNPHFLAFMLRSPNFRKRIVFLAQGISRYNISKEKVMDLNLYVPSLEEQHKTGNLIKGINNLIALHQRKLDLLKQLKQGYLHIMFPQKGESVPRLRFANFDGNWDQRKLSELAEETFGGGTPKTSIKEYWNGKIPWIQSSNLKLHNTSEVTLDKHITCMGLENSSAKLIPKNSIAIVTRVGVGKLVLMSCEYTTSQDFLSLSHLRMDELFGVYSIYKRLQRESQVLQGTSIKGITSKELLSTKISIPSNLQEQNKIGKLLKQLDSTITLNQTKLDRLQSLKAVYLQKMFV